MKFKSIFSNAQIVQRDQFCDLKPFIRIVLCSAMLQLITIIINAVQNTKKHMGDLLFIKWWFKKTICFVIYHVLNKEFSEHSLLQVIPKSMVTEKIVCIVYTFFKTSSHRRNKWGLNKSPRKHPPPERYHVHYNFMHDELNWSLETPSWPIVLLINPNISYKNTFDIKYRKRSWEHC